MLAPERRTVPESFLVTPPPVPMTPEISIEPVATAPVPLRVRSDRVERRVPEMVRVPVVSLLVMASVSLNTELAEIASRPAPVLVMALMQR